MDTPEKTQITTPLSKFEDSPVFSYINSLSPIKPVKSIHIQTFQSLSFASLPSIFTSPHVSSHKESRFLKRHSNSDLSKPEVSLFNGNKVSSDAGNVVGGDQLYDNSAELEGNFNTSVPVGEASVENSCEHLKFAIEVPQNLKYDCGSPDADGASTTHCGAQKDNVLEPALVKDDYQRISNEGEVHLQRTYHVEQKKEVTECDWENLISDTADLLIFNSPVETEAFKGLIQRSLDPEAGFCSSINELHQVQIFCPTGSGEEQDMEDPSTQPGEAVEPDDNDNLSKSMTGNLSMETDNERITSIACKAVSNLNRGMRRRCLDFEMVGARKNNGDERPSSTSSMLVQSDGKIDYNDNQLVPLKPGSDSSKCILPGIGLHLNALAATSKDNNKVMQENLSSRISLPSSTASLHSPTTGQEPDESLPLVSTERDMDPNENDILLEKDVELNQNSPKKKRRKIEGESESCKRCNCKKSKCLKLYCECFAAGVYCIEPCSCQDCFNKPIHEDTVLATRKQIESRNPLAFAPKVIRSTETIPEVGDDSSKTPASARHKRGCNCKKSSCLKKYCECYQGGVGCSINCRCEGCKNAFGRKDGSAPVESELEPDDEAEACEKATRDKASEKTEIQNNEEQNPSSVLPTTPLQLCRSLVPLPFSSKSKPPRALLSIGSSSGLSSSQKYGKPNIIRPQSKFEKQFQTVLDDDMPELLRGSFTPSNGMKTCSPNSKRVSPPNSNFVGSSPGLRSGRKLILQSIPSFPSLTPQH